MTTGFILEPPSPFLRVFNTSVQDRRALPSRLIRLITQKAASERQSMSQPISPEDLHPFDAHSLRLGATPPVAADAEDALQVLATVAEEHEVPQTYHYVLNSTDAAPRFRVLRTVVLMPTWNEATTTLNLNFAIDSPDSYLPPRDTLLRYLSPILDSAGRSSQHYTRSGAKLDETNYEVEKQILRGVLDIAKPMDSTHIWETRVCKDVREWESWLRDTDTRRITSSYGLHPDRFWIGMAPLQNSENMVHTPQTDHVTQIHAPTSIYLPSVVTDEDLHRALDEAVTRHSSLVSFRWGPIKAGPVKDRLNKFVRAMMFTEAMSVPDKMLLEASHVPSDTLSERMTTREHFERTWETIRRMDNAFGVVDLEVVDDEEVVSLSERFMSVVS